MKILNIHGYHETPNNFAAVALKKLGHEIVSMKPIDYDSENPQIIIDRLSNLLSENSPDVIVGTSIGGFFAAVLSARNDLPVILVNPCIIPELNESLSLFWELADLNLYNVSTIVGEKDEIIDHSKITKAFLYNQRYKIIPNGKHSGATLPLEEFFKETIEHINNTKEYNPEKAIDIFCSRINKQLIQKFKNDELFKSGNVLAWVNLNGQYHITVNSYDKSKAIIEYTVEGEEKPSYSYLDHFYILDKEWLSDLYKKAPNFNDKYDAPNIIGVYILCYKNKYYVGQAKNIRYRMCDHYQNESNDIQRALRADNENVTKRYIALEGSGYSDLDALETAFIAYFDCKNNGYNETRGNKLLLDGSRKKKKS